ncbi:MAG: UDP-glucose 4-epimerase GalE [Erysipelotrichaceae bacterium]|nr:UDP-glucose 4-epimerase GalE [Erysipelotrichaceae bacterium]
MKILVTGGTGFIGSHTCVELLDSGYEVVILDNLSNSQRDVVKKIQTITQKTVHFYEGDCCDKQMVEKIFKEHHIDAVIHFAGYKAVGESVCKPLMYYQNNLMSTLTLCEVMNQYECKQLVFSSSATVYGDPEIVPIDETSKLGPTTNPYGTTKLYIEQILRDLYVSDPSWNIALLRYFNPIGAHASGFIGESPNDIPNNLMPYIVKVANKELPQLHVFGNDYDTHDGTGIRDYIHVVDLAKGHICSINNFLLEHVGVEAYNLGTGFGYSVLDVVHTFMKVNDVDVPYVIDERRPGDIASCYAKTEKAYQELGWKAEKNLNDMCKDAWNYVKHFKLQ